MPEDRNGVFHDDGVEYWTADRMAWLFSLSPRQMRRLAESHELPYEVRKIGGKGKAIKCFRPVDAVAAYVERAVRNALSRHAPRPDGDMEDVDKALKQVRMQLVAEQTENARHKNMVNNGTLVFASDVEADLRRFFTEFKQFATTLDKRIAGQLSGLLDPVEIRRITEDISEGVRDQLNSFVDSWEPDEGGSG